MDPELADLVGVIVNAVTTIVVAWVAWQQAKNNTNLGVVKTEVGVVKTQVDKIEKHTNSMQEARIVAERKDSHAEGVIDGMEAMGTPAVEAVVAVVEDPVVVKPAPEEQGK